jgi:hypothetical protein
MNCDHCKRETSVMFEMQPGKDKQPWRLCAKCWPAGIDLATVTKGRKR